LGPENPDSLRRLAACELARLGHKDGVSVLIELLRTKDIRLRKSVVRSLRALTRTNFGYPMRTRARRRSAPTHEVAPEEAIAAWEAWWKKREATFVFPHPPISTRPVDRPPTTRRRRQDGTAAKPSIFVDTAERQKVLEGARAVFGNKNARPREKVLKLSEAYRYDLRELKADVQRLANEDPYESVRRAASFLLDKWERQPASAPGAAMGSSATVPGALHEGQRTKVPAGGKGPTMRDIALLTAKRALNDPNAPFPRRVSKLAEVLGHDLRELKPDLERLAREDASPRIRRDATSILERWKQQDAAAARAKARMDQLRRRAEMTPEERRAADKSAERRYFTGHRDQYLRELKEGALEQRRLAVRTAFTWAEYVPEALPILRDIIKNEDDLALRYGAVMALGKHGGQEAVPLLRTCLASRNPEKLRWVAASELARLGDKEGVGVLVQLLRTDDVKAQTNTIMILRTVTRAEFGYPTEIELAQSISPEQEVARRKAIAAWEAWWKDNGATFVMPYPPGTTITSQPTTRPARKESRVGTGAQGSSP